MSNLQFGEFTLNRRLRELRKQGAVLPLTGKAFDLLCYMASNAGRPLSKAELLDAVWPETMVEEANLSQNVFLLRKIVGAGSEGPIKTLPGRGYQFAAEVQEIQGFSAPASFLSTGVGASVTMEATETRVIVRQEVVEQISWPSPRPLLLAAAAVVVLAIAGWFGWRQWQSLHRGASAPETAGTSSRPALAVLGFRNTSSRPEDAWLSTAISEMLATEMTVGDKLRVVSTEEVAHALSDLAGPGGAIDPGKSRETLQQATGADMLIDGSYVVLSQGERPAIRLLVQVKDARSGRQLHSFSETGEVSGLFALVDRAGSELRSKLSDNVAGTPEAASGMSRNAEALRLYAEGVEQARRFDAHGARGLFERAVEADPEFAMAHLGLADAWAELGSMGRATKEAEQAYKLSANLPRQQRLAIEADYRNFANDTEDAIRIYKSLATFYPDEAKWGLKLALAQRDDGQLKESLATLERVRTLPLTPWEMVELNSLESVAYAHLDDPQANVKARALGEEAVAIATKQGGLLLRAQALRSQCFALSHIGPVPAARAACEEAKATFGAIGNIAAVASATNNLGVLSQQVGDWQQAESEYAEAQREDHQIGAYESEVTDTINLAHLHLAHGQLEKAIEESTELSHITGTSDDAHTAYEGHHYAAIALLLAGRLPQARLEGLAAQRSADQEHPWDYKLYQQARSRDVLGSIALTGGELDEANRSYQEALTMLKPSNDSSGEAIFTADQAGVALEQGQVSPETIGRLRRAVAVLAKLEDQTDERIAAEVTLAQLLARSGDLAGATSLLAEAASLDSKGDTFDTHLGLLLGQADLQQALGHAKEARRILHEEVGQASSRNYSYSALKGAIELALLDHRNSPSPEDEQRLQALARQAEESGFHGLARLARTP